MVVHSAQTGERSALLDIALKTRLFTPDEAEALLGGTLDGLADGSLPETHQSVVCRAPAGEALGWSYFAPDAYAEDVWNIWWLGVAPEHHGQGVAQALLSHIEQTITQLGGRVIVIETSDQQPLARARRFYAKSGYSECGRIPDFYGAGDAKVILARSMTKVG
ncbi:MAG: GNAT family N-acetyltransferase [Thiothrix sp.]|nr:MAG: GNAT family N-acetyltransferase [Thiothrix sp.]